jgi:hypothetical protein
MADPYAPHKSLISLLAVAAAIGSFFVHSGVLGLLLAVVAVVLGVIGFVISFAPRVSGGGLSVLAMLMGIIGAVCGLIRAGVHLLHHV